MTDAPPRPPLDVAPLLAELLVRLNHQDDKLRRLESSVMALARLPADPPGGTTADTRPVSSAPTPASIPWPGRALPGPANGPLPPPPTPAPRTPPPRANPARPGDDGPTARVGGAGAEAGLLRAAAEAATDALVGLDGLGRVRVWNPAAAALFGWPADEVVGEFPPFLPPDKGAEHDDWVRQARAGRGPTDAPAVRRRRDGELIGVRVTARPAGGGGVAFAFRFCPPPPADQPPAPHRLATLGRVLVGVAHDVNNLLTVIRANGELLAEQFAPGDPRHEAAAAVADAGAEAAEMTRHLLAAAAPSPRCPRPADPNEVLGRLDRLLHKVVGHGVRVVVHPGPGVGRVRADGPELTQVLLNLVTNARDAMPGGGTLTVRTARQPVAAGRDGWPAGVPAGEYVVVTVGDTGVGMDADTRDRMFDPFYTTKGDGGTGVGMSTVREVVARAGGHIEVESAPGWGTQVRVYLPPA